MSLVSWLTRIALMVFLGVSVVACGPGASSVYINRAEMALGVAETAGAKRFALYEWTKAKAYLDKAKEEQAYSDFAASRNYAKKAAILADIAKKKAKVEMRIDGSSPKKTEESK